MEVVRTDFNVWRWWKDFWSIAEECTDWFDIVVSDVLIIANKDTYVATRIGLSAHIQYCTIISSGISKRNKLWIVFKYLFIDWK